METPLESRWLSTEAFSLSRVRRAAQDKAPRGQHAAGAFVGKPGNRRRSKGSRARDPGIVGDPGRAFGAGGVPQAQLPTKALKLLMASAATEWKTCTEAAGQHGMRGLPVPEWGTQEPEGGG